MVRELGSSLLTRLLAMCKYVSIERFCLAAIILIVCSLLTRGEAQTIMEEHDCKANLAATGQYVLILKDQRDWDEKEIARLRYKIDHLTEENNKVQWKMEKEMKK